MNEIIARISSENDYVEIASKSDNEEATFKKIDGQAFANIVNETLVKYKEVPIKKDIRLLDPQIIAVDEHYVVVRQEGRKRIVNYNGSGQMHVYNISFPNAVYIINFVDEKIMKIECFSYIEYEAEETALYEYPLPNELYGNSMCMGNADRKIHDGDVIGALERIIFTPYTHQTFSGMNGFSRTKSYFEYLENNEFPYKLMRSLNKKLSDVLKG